MASPFQTQVANDLSNVFMNLNEFADAHNINGVDGVICVIDYDDTMALRPGLGHYDGSFKETVMLFIKVSDWQWEQPADKQLVILDLIRYRIKEAHEFNGLYEILLEAVK